MIVTRHARMGAFIALALAGCGTESATTADGANCRGSGAAGGGNRVALNLPNDDPAIATAVAAAAQSVGISPARFQSEYDGYESGEPRNGARCFQFNLKACSVGGEVSLCVTPSLEVKDLFASE